MVLLFCFILYVKASADVDDNKTLNVNIYDNFLGLVNLVTGRVTKLDDMFLPLDSEHSDTSDADDTKDEQELALMKRAVFKLEEFDLLRPKTMTRDIAEFNDITKILQNESRRYGGVRRAWSDLEDVDWSWWSWVFGAGANYDIEWIKKERMSNMNLQWLVHARIVVKKALLLKREDVRTDKRYKIGYLMSRLRIIKNEQQKITSFANSQARDYFRSLQSMLKLYERMVRYEVDIKDTIVFIKELDKEPIPTLADQPTTTTEP